MCCLEAGPAGGYIHAMFFGERPTPKWVAKRILFVVFFSLLGLAMRREFSAPTHLEVTWRLNPQGDLVIDRSAIVPDATSAPPR